MAAGETDIALKNGQKVLARSISMTSATSGPWVPAGTSGLTGDNAYGRQLR